MKETKERATAPVEEPKWKDSVEEERIRERMASMPDPLEQCENAGEGEKPDPRDFLTGGPAGRRVPWPRPWDAVPVETPPALAGLELAAAYLVDSLLLRAGRPDGETREALGFFGREYQAAKARIRLLSTAPRPVEGRAPWLADETPEEAEERYQAWRKAMEEELAQESPAEIEARRSWEESKARGGVRKIRLADRPPVPWPSDPEDPETPKALGGLEAAAAQAMRALLADGHFPTPPHVLEALDAFGRAFAGASVRVHSLEGLRDGMGAAMIAFASAKRASSRVFEYLSERDCVDILAEAGDAHDFLVEGMKALTYAGMAGDPLARLAAAIGGLEDGEMRDFLRESVRAFRDSRRSSQDAGAEGRA